MVALQAYPGLGDHAQRTLAADHETVGYQSDARTWQTPGRMTLPGVTMRGSWPDYATKDYCSNLGLIRFSNENTSSHCCDVISLRSLTTTSYRDLPPSKHSRAISEHCL